MYTPAKDQSKSCLLEKKIEDEKNYTLGTFNQLKGMLH